MLRLISFLVALAALAFGVAWLVDRPGEVSVRWLGQDIETTMPVVLGLALVVAISAVVLWGLVRYLWRTPGRARGARSARQRRKGYEALTRGLVAAGAGDLRAARKASDEVGRRLPHEPLGLLLQAQVAQLGGDRAGAETAFVRMAERPETRLLGLRGLHIEARRRDDAEAAHEYAREAHRLAALPWAGEALVRHETAAANWAAALETVEANARARTIDAATAERQRAVLETAIAQEIELTDPEGALRRARQAVARAPDLVPAVALAARLLARNGSMKAGAKMIERAWSQAPHPDLAAAYLDMRPGDSNADRHARAKHLARRAPEHAESAMMLATTALAMRDFAGARAAMAPLVADGERPAARACLLMAEIEEKEHGQTGLARQWLARSARARRDPAWIADGIVSKRWAPASPVTGKLDAFRWTTPIEQAGVAPPEPVLAPISATPVKPDQPLLIDLAEPAPSAAEPAEAPQATPAREEPEAKPEPADGAALAAEPAAARPVVFPMPAPPDDPGPKPKADKPGRLI